MTEVFEHRGWEAIESIRLKWTRALGETRWAHFTLQWNWLKYQALQHIVQWEPCVLEVAWGSRTVGFLPLWRNRRSSLWTSPNRLSGVGPATPVGKETTVIWIGALRWLMNQQRDGTILDLGPFHSRHPVARRLESACERTGARPWRRQSDASRQIDLSSSLAAEPTSTATEVQFSSTDPEFDSSDSFDSRFEEQVLHRDPQDITWYSPTILPANPLFRDATLASLAHDGLLHLTQSSVPHRDSATGVLWLGNRQQVLPLAVVTAAASRMPRLEPHLQMLAKQGFLEIEAAGLADLTITPAPSHLHTYRIVSRFRWSDAWSSWWSRGLAAVGNSTAEDDR